MFGPLLGAGIGLATSLFNNRNSNRRDPAVDNLLQQIPQFGREGYQPYIDRGNQAQDLASGAYNRMAQDPTAFVEQIMQSYKPSQGYQFRRKNALNAAQNSAASGGFSGTGYDQMNQGALADDLASQDMQQYLQNILGVQGAGIAGQQHQADQGYLASGNLADYLGNAYGARAGAKLGQNRQRGLNDANTGGAFGNFANAGLETLGSGGFSSRQGSFGGPGGFLTKAFGGFK